MSEDGGPPNGGPQRPRIRRWSAIPWVWAVPVIALSITVWLGLRTVVERGPQIKITFSTAEGIDAGRNEAGRATLRYKNVELGRVTKIELSGDRTEVVVTAEMSHNAEPLLRSNTQFWVVRPRIDLGGISGLSTLVTGAYIGMLPGDGPEGARNFVGLENPPPAQGLIKGKTYTLLSERLPAVSDGAPVYFHGVKVGEVMKHDLSDRDGKVAIDVFIYDPHSALIHPGSEFWVSAGIEADLGAQGLAIQTETVQTVLTGGIVFETSAEALATPESAPGSRFMLYRDRKSAEEAADPVRVSYRVVFPGTPRGLAHGTPVELHGVRIGRVSGLRLEYDAVADTVRVPAVIEISPHRIAVVGEPPIPDSDPVAVAAATNRLFERLIAKGLRAQLAPDNLLLGSKVVELDFVNKPEPAQLVLADPYPELPTTAGGGLEEISKSATALLDKLAALPLPELIGSLRELVRHGDAVIDSPEVKRAIQQLDRTLANTEKLTRTAQVQSGPLLAKLNTAAEQLNATMALLGNDPRSSADLAHMLAEFRDAARSVRVLADMLERHPEALLLGKSRAAAR